MVWHNLDITQFDEHTIEDSLTYWITNFDTSTVPCETRWEAMSGAYTLVLSLMQDPGVTEVDIDWGVTRISNIQK